MMPRPSASTSNAAVSDVQDYSLPAAPIGVRLLEAVHEESETSSMSSASIRSISLDTPDEEDGEGGQAPTPPPKSTPSTAPASNLENEAPPLIQVGERKASWRAWLGFRGPAEDAETEELADANGPPSPAISDTPSTPGGAGPFPYAFLQDPTPSGDTVSMIVHAGDRSSTTSTSKTNRKKKQYLLTVLPAKELSTDSPGLKKRALSRRGSLVPLHASLRAQAEAIAHEFRLPSSDDVALYLLSTTDAVRSQIPTEDGPRIGEAAWRVLWSDLFAGDDDDRLTRDASFSSSEAFLSPLPPATPSQSSGLFGSYNFFSAASLSSPNPQPLQAPDLKRSKSTPTSSPYLNRNTARRLSTEDQDGAAFGAAVVVGRVEFDLEPSSEDFGARGGKYEGHLNGLTAFERRRSSGTSASSMAERERELGGFPSIERRRSSGTSSDGAGGRRPSAWAKRRGSTKPSMRSEEEGYRPPLPIPSATKSAAEPMVPSPPRWSPALSRGLFTPVEPPSDQFPSPAVVPLEDTQPLNFTRSTGHSYLSPPTHNLASRFSSAGSSPASTTPSLASPPPHSQHQQESDDAPERRPSISVGLASFLGNVKAEEHMQALAEEEEDEEAEEIGLGVFGVSRDRSTGSPSALADRPDSTASSVPELVDTLEALQEALGLDTQNGSRRPSAATTRTNRSTRDGSEQPSSRRGSAQSAGGRSQGHERSQSSPVLELNMVNPFASEGEVRRRAPKRLPRSSELAADNPHRWSTVSPRNSAYLPTPSRAAPAPPMPPLPRVASPPTLPAPTSATANSTSKSSPPLASPPSTAPAGRFSLDSVRPKMSELSAALKSSADESKTAAAPSMWSALPKLGGFFGAKQAAAPVEFTEVPVASSPASTVTSPSNAPEDEVPMPGKTPRPRTRSLSKKFASFRSNLPASACTPSSTVTDVPVAPRSHGHSNTPSTSSSMSASSSHASLVLSPHAVSAVTNSSSTRRSAGEVPGYTKHRPAVSLDSSKSIPGTRPRFEVELRSADGVGEKRRVELPKDVLRAMI